MSTSSHAPHRTVVRACRLGRVEYVATADLQRSLRAAREAGATSDLLLTLEHDPVITCGTRTTVDEVAVARTTGVPIVAVERGGKATWHGPGQVVVYPIIDLAIVDGDVRELVCRLEGAIIDVLASRGVMAGRRAGLPGVWVDAQSEAPRKIASVGLRLTRGVTFHGIAVNVANDLAPFDWFTPCGIPDARMTTLARELALEAAPVEELRALVREVEHALVDAIAEAFGFAAEATTAAELAELAAAHPVDPPELLLPWERTERTATRIDLVAGVVA